MYSYIWMGNLDSSINKVCCGLGPNSFAENMPDKTAILWVPEYLVNEAESLFKTRTNIEVRSVDRMLKGEYGELKHINEQVKDIQQLIESMQKTNSYAAQKDILSIAIIAEYGGYYFDCTTKFTAASELPQVSDFKIRLTEKCYDLSPEIFNPLYGSDIWIFASSGPGHPLFLEILKNNLSRYSGNEWKNSDTGLTSGLMTGALINLYEDGAGDHDWIKEHAWKSISIDQGHSIPELGLEKYNLGLWRRKEGELPQKSLSNDPNSVSFHKLGFFKEPNKNNDESESFALESERKSPKD